MNDLNDSDPILVRLNEQITWYDQKSTKNQERFKLFKVIEIVAAALIPLLAALPIPHVVWITGGLGALISICEAVLQLNQYQNNWISYRSTAEALKHEKYVFLGNAAPYANIPDSRSLLAERIESLVSQENAKWASTQHQEQKAAKNT